MNAGCGTAYPGRGGAGCLPDFPPAHMRAFAEFGLEAPGYAPEVTPVSREFSSQLDQPARALERTYDAT
eukprot:9467544-Pyramimonas_sp.AAC.1